MPEIRYYTVTETREAKVSANNPTDAALLADRVFSGTKKPGDQISVQAYPRVRSLHIREDD